MPPVPSARIRSLNRIAALASNISGSEGGHDEDRSNDGHLLAAIWREGHRLAADYAKLGLARRHPTLLLSDVRAALDEEPSASIDIGATRRDLKGGVQGHGSALNALRETQLEQGHEIREICEGLVEQGREMPEGFATLATGMAQITTLLTDLDGPEGLK